MPHPLPVIANAHLVTQRFTSPNELHDMAVVMCVTAPGGTALTDVADGLADAWQAQILPIQSAGINLGSTSVTPLDGLTPTATFVTDGTGAAGGHGTGNAFPNSIAMGMTWQTARRGKSFRGRSYIPGVTDDMFQHATTRALTVAQLANLQASGTNFIAAMLALPIPLVPQVLSRKLGTIQAIITARANVGGVEQRRRYERVAHR